MKDVETKLREEVKQLLSEGKVDVVIGYEEGTLPYQAAPCFIENPDDADKLVWNSFCSVNLAKYVHDVIFRHRESQKRAKPEERTKKTVGVVARGCTTRSLILYLQEQQFDRDQIVIIGVPCTGYVSKKKLSAAFNGKEILECNSNGASLTVKTADGSSELALKDVLSDSCLTCRYNNPIISDILIGEPAPAMDIEREYAAVDDFENMSEGERWAYFNKEMSKCIRCYACRNTCPSCYCKICFLEQSQPKWVGVGIDESDTQVFQIMRMFHMAGRCVDCGSCVEVCPMGVDLRRFLKKLDKEDFSLFEHRAGESLESPPPFSTHKMDDKEEFIFEPE